MKLAVLGLGFMGSMHLKALKQVPDAEVVAVCSSDERKLAGDLSGIQGNIGGPGERLDFSRVKKHRTLESALADPDIEAIDICLPTHLHAQVAIEAIRAGKHVLVEKPMALDAAACQRMIDEARQHNRVLMTAQVLRFLPPYQALREALQTRGVGLVRSALFRRRCAAPAWSKWLSDAGLSGGGVFDLLIHDIDICLHLFGTPDAVTATGFEAMETGIDLITAQLFYAHGGVAVITGGWHHPKSYPFSMEYTVVGDGGTVEYSSAGREPTLYRADGEAEALRLRELDGYAAELAYFVECAKNSRAPELCSPEESAEAVRLMRLLLEARNRNGERIECKLYKTSNQA
ncbi:MAG TPA: Gfo/Idh/MocA family oxidoreductase [Bryobacteraceae bacterium]|nr:Gfo/Idh/MocA family oxidoreductase [Bryobacteraceae bacterium]